MCSARPTLLHDKDKQNPCKNYKLHKIQGVGNPVRETFPHQNIHPKYAPDDKKETKLPENGKPCHHAMLPNSVMPLILCVPALAQRQ